MAILGHVSLRKITWIDVACLLNLPAYAGTCQYKAVYILKIYVIWYLLDVLCCFKIIVVILKWGIWMATYLDLSHSNNAFIRVSWPIQLLLECCLCICWIVMLWMSCLREYKYQLFSLGRHNCPILLLFSLTTNAFLFKPKNTVFRIQSNWNIWIGVFFKCLPQENKRKSRELEKLSNIENLDVFSGENFFNGMDREESLDSN